MQTFNDEKKKNNTNIFQQSLNTVKNNVSDYMKQTANKANPTLTGSVVPAVKNVAPRTSAIPGVKVHSNAPEMIGNYSFDTDFMAEIQKAEAEGNYGLAKYLENLRNQKLGYMTSPYSTTSVYNYDDPYKGELERMQDDIINREKFSYDYRDDEQYQAIKRLKEKEAQDAFDDAYGQLSRQFEGDIPVNMINKLYDTKADIIDSADSYIPQLQQLAYSMYMNEGDQMMQNYAMMQNMANQDYNRWAADRDMHVSGLDNKYARDYNDRNYNEELRRYNQEYEDTRSDIEYERGKEEQQRETGISAENIGAINQWASIIREINPGISPEESIKEARRILEEQGMLLS